MYQMWHCDSAKVEPGFISLLEKLNLSPSEGGAAIKCCPQHPTKVKGFGERASAAGCETGGASLFRPAITPQETCWRAPNSVHTLQQTSPSHKHTQSLTDVTLTTGRPPFPRPCPPPPALCPVSLCLHAVFYLLLLRLLFQHHSTTFVW